MALLTKAGSFARPAAGTTNTVVTGLGFKPAAVLLLSGDPLATNTWRAALQMAVGWIAPVLTNPTEARVQTARIYGANGGVPDFRVAYTNFAGPTVPDVMVNAATLDANGFTIDWANSPYDAEQELVGYLALGGDLKAATASATVGNMVAGQEELLAHDVPFIPTAALVNVIRGDGRSGSIGVIGGAGQWAINLHQDIVSVGTPARRRLAPGRAAYLTNTAGSPTVDAQGAISREGLTLMAASGESYAQTYGVAHTALTGPQQMTLSWDEAYLYVQDYSNARIYRMNAATGAAVTPHVTDSRLDLGLAVTRAHPDSPATNPASTSYGVSRNSLIYSSKATSFGPNSPIIGAIETAAGSYSTPLWQRGSGITAVPRGLAPASAQEQVYTDPAGQTVRLAKAFPAGQTLAAPVVIAGGSGTTDGKFTGINRVAVSGNDMYVTDYLQNRVQKFTLVRNGSNQVIGATFALKFGETGTGNGQLKNPHDVAVDPTTGDVWVSDTDNNRICRFGPDGAWKENVSVPGRPVGLAINAAGAIFTMGYDDETLRRWERSVSTNQVQVLYLGNVMADAGVVTKPTGAAPASQAIAGGVKSKALLLGTVATTTDDTNVAGWRASFGVDDGTSRFAVGGVAQSGVGTGNADTIARTDRSLIVADNDTPTLEAAATVAWASKKPTVTWNPNNAVATRYGYLALGDANLFQAFAAAELTGLGSKLGNNLQFSARARAELVATAQNFGNLGNWPGSNVAQAYLVATGTGLGFDRNFTGLVEAAAQVVTPGFGFNRQFTALVTAEALASVRRLGNGVWEGSAKVEAAGFASAVGFGFDRNFTALGRAALNSEAYFEIQLPAPRTALPDELPGTVNWVLNPSVEFTSGTLGWEAEEGATIARVVSEQGSWDGAAGLKVETPGDLAGEGFHVESVTGLELTGYREDGRVRRVVGQVRLRADSGTVAGLVYVTRRFYQDGTSETTDPVELPELTTNWWRLETSTVDLDPEKVMVRIEVAVLTAAAQESVFWADGAQIEEDIGQGASSWVTGSYGADTGVWAGAANQSMSVRQPLPAIVRGIGRGGAVVVESVMYESDQNNVFQRVLEKTVIDAKVTMDSGRSSTWKLDATMTLKGYRDLRPNETWLSPWLKVTYPDGTVLEGQLGHYLMVPSEQERFEYGGKVKVAAYDALWLMDRQEMGDILTLPPNTNYSTALRSILQEMRMPDGTRMKRFTIPDSQYLIGDAVAWEEDTSRLKAANELAEAGALYPLATDAVGWISTKRMGNERLAAQAPVKAWAANLDDQASINEWIPRIAAVKSEVVGAVTISPRALDFVDKIIVASVNPKAGELRVQADIVGSPDQDARAQIRGFPYANTGGRRTINNPLIANPAAAQQIAFTIADQLTARVEHAKISVLPDPSIDYLRGTAVLGIWDAYQDPVVVGLYAIRRVSFGFTPSTCLQTIDLDYVGAGENQIVIKAA